MAKANFKSNSVTFVLTDELIQGLEKVALALQKQTPGIEVTRTNATRVALSAGVAAILKKKTSNEY